MSLLLNGAKTTTIAGTEMQVLEIYTGESYTLPFAFTDSAGNAIDCTGWTLGTTAKFYSTTDITYTDADSIVLGNLTLDVPQPSTGGSTYSVVLTAAFSNASIGTGYIFIPTNISGGNGSPNATPVISLANSAAPSTLVIVTLAVTRTDALSGLIDITREPIGIVPRYQ